MSGEITLTLLGTGSPIPDPNRAGPSSLVRAGGATILVDAGRGVVTRLAGAMCSPPMLDAVLLTHLHSDHICDLNDVITTRWVMSPIVNPLRLYGPPGTAAMIEGLLAMLQADVGYRIGHHEDINDPPAIDVFEVGPGDHFEIGELRLEVGETNHRPVEPTVAFKISHEDTSVVMAGDGVPCEGLDMLLRGATAYVQTAIRDDLVKQVPMQRFQDILDYHSTVDQAAETAERAGVKQLILTHYVPAPPLGQYQEWLDMASGFSGEVICGDDLTTVSVTN